MGSDGFEEARRLWTRLYLEIPHEEGCFEDGKETNPDEFPLLRAKHLARLVSEERAAEREECAKIAGTTTGSITASYKIANAIRALGGAAKEA